MKVRGKLKIKLLKFIFIYLLSIGPAYAQKLSFGFGLYNVNASVEGEETQVSNLGAYKFQYNFNIKEKLDIFVGYDLLVEDIITGDKAFGPQVGIAYYPRGSKTISSSLMDGISFLKMKDFNYYFSGSFTQRQYQSIKTSYAGFSIGGGVEWGLNEDVIFYSDIQNSFLEGANEGSASELIGTFGIRFYYD